MIALNWQNEMNQDLFGLDIVANQLPVTVIFCCAASNETLMGHQCPLSFREGQTKVTLEMSQCILPQLFEMVGFFSAIKREVQLLSNLPGKRSKDASRAQGLKIQGKEIKHLRLAAAGFIAATHSLFFPPPPKPREIKCMCEREKGTWLLTSATLQLGSGWERRAGIRGMRLHIPWKWWDTSRRGGDGWRKEGAFRASGERYCRPVCVCARINDLMLFIFISWKKCTLFFVF